MQRCCNLHPCLAGRFTVLTLTLWIAAACHYSLVTAPLPFPTPDSQTPDTSAATSGVPSKAAPTGNVSGESLKYPLTRKEDVVDTYHGVQVPDPYRWLEDDNSAETKAWVEAQNEVTYAYLEKLPQREPLRRRLTDIVNYERHGIPQRKGGRYFFRRNNGLQNQDLICMSEQLDGEAVVVLDPNTLSTDGTVAVPGYAVSEDGRYMAYSIAKSGSDWREIRVRDLSTGKDLEDHVEWVKFSGISWKKDGTGFFYSRYDSPPEGQEFTQVNEFNKLYFHRLGTPQSQDILIYERPDKPKWGFYAGVSDDGRYLIIEISEGTDRRNRVYYQSLDGSDTKVVALLDDFDASYSFIDNDGPIFWFKTDLDAARSRVIAIDVRQPAREHWRTLIPESDATLSDVTVVGEHFIVSFLKDARSLIRLHKLDGSPVREIQLPDLGTAGGFQGRRNDPETFFSFTSFTSPGRVYRHDVASDTTTPWRHSRLTFDPSTYETRQVWVTSKDGTRLPMFLTHKRGIELNGNHPTLLYAYGGFQISLTPSFRSDTIAWLEMGGIYAMPNLRGGGEYGEAWHRAGTRLQKQNVFDDFIASAEWLIKEGYTRAERLAIRGGSNGGLLVGACMTQRPELFGACLPAVGVMDMLRFHRFTIGWAWVSDYGSSDDSAEFKALYAYSPYHNLRKGTAYPPTLITTADHDDRVVPAHSFKFAARLQEMHQGPNPVLIRIETKAGHGAGKPISKQIEESADILSFLARQLEISSEKQ